MREITKEEIAEALTRVVESLNTGKNMKYLRVTDYKIWTFA